MELVTMTQTSGLQNYVLKTSSEAFWLLRTWRYETGHDKHMDLREKLRYTAQF